MSKAAYLLVISGFCPICQKKTTFRATDPWLRGSLLCQGCPNGSVPRERALALVMRETLPQWQNLRIHECSPVNRGLSVVLKRECAGYVGTHYWPDEVPGIAKSGWINENLEKQTFPDASFDVVVAQDVLEHVFNPDAALREVFRSLKPGATFSARFPSSAP